VAAQRLAGGPVEQHERPAVGVAGEPGAVGQADVADQAADHRRRLGVAFDVLEAAAAAAGH
jgi:hypothetical protein